MNESLTVLHLEDDPADAELIRLTLEAETGPVTVQRVDTRAGFEAALQRERFDLVLSDYAVPGFSGPGALELARALAPEVPFIIVSGALDEDTAVALVRGGATDYVLKSRLRRLAPAIHQALREAHERQARREAERLLKQHVERLALLADAAQAFAEAGPAYHSVLNAVTRRVADLLRDGCTLRLLSDDEQWLGAAAIWHHNPRTLEFLRQLAEQPMPAAGTGIASQVLSTGHSRLIAVLPQGELRQTVGEAWLPYWNHFGGHSLLAVPLWSRGRVIGVIVVTRDETRAAYTLDDQHLLRGLADRAALAIENARLYEAAQSAWGAAEIAADRTARLQSVTARLAAALTPDQVGGIIVNEGAAALGATAATLQLLAPAGNRLEVVNVTRRQPRLKTRHKALSLSDATPSAEVMRTGQAVWLASHAEAVARFPRLVELRLIAGYEALAVLPMTVDSRPIGTLAINFPETRVFNPEDQAFMLTLAGLCAQALERARLFDAERLSRQAAEQAADRTARLQLVAATLSQAVTPQQVIALAVEHGVAALGAAAGSIGLLDRAHTALEIVESIGYTSDALAQFGTVPLEAPIPVAEAARTGQAVWIETAAELAVRYPMVAAAHAALGHGAAAAVPLAQAGQPAGALALSFAGPRHFDAPAKALILALTQQCAQALERARLFTEVEAHNTALEARVRERTEQLRALSTRLESLREEERARLSREVHDELGGALTAIKMDITRLARRAGPPAELQAGLAATVKLIDSTVQTVRRIATDLRPALLDDFGLVAAIEWQGQEFARRTGIQCQLNLEVDEVELDEQAATALFRVFQETLTNVARHARATRVTVRLARQPDCVQLTLSDNGEGFQLDEVDRQPSLGLAGMRERIFSIAGELDIQSQPGAGTTVVVTVPLPSRTSS